MARNNRLEPILNRTQSTSTTVDSIKAASIVDSAVAALAAEVIESEASEAAVLAVVLVVVLNASATAIAPCELLKATAPPSLTESVAAPSVIVLFDAVVADFPISMCRQWPHHLQKYQ